MQQVHCVILDKKTYWIVTREAIFSDWQARMFFLYLLTFFIFARMLDEDRGERKIQYSNIIRILEPNTSIRIRIWVTF